MKLVFYSLLLVLFCCLTFAIFRYESRDEFLSVSSTKRHPILLFPGLGASQLEAKINKRTAPPSCPRMSDWFRLWLNPASMSPKVIDCFFDNMRLVWNEARNQPQNAPGVETRVAGFGSTDEIEYVIPRSGHTRSPETGYFNVLVEGLVKLGYKRDKSIRGAPYDFRLAPNQAPEYFIQTTKLIEQMYTENGNNSVILIGHSMGCLYSYYLLLQQPQEWKDTYIHSWVPIAGPFAGSTMTFQSMVIGNNIASIPSLSPMTFRPLMRSLPAIYFMLPDPEVFNKTIIMTMGGKNYTTDDYDQLFDLMGNANGKKIWKATRGLFKDYPFPGVTTHCLKGKNVSTPESLNYQNKTSFPLKSELKYGDGDGTVNSVSADVCMKWRNQPNFHSKDFNGIQHTPLLRHADTVAFVVHLVLEANFVSTS